MVCAELSVCAKSESSLRGLGCREKVLVRTYSGDESSSAHHGMARKWTRSSGGCEAGIVCCAVLTSGEEPEVMAQN